jgi:hypothetical protein
VVENHQDQIVSRSRSESETRDQRGGVVAHEYTHGSRDRRMVECESVRDRGWMRGMGNGGRGVAVDLTKKNPNTVTAKTREIKMVHWPSFPFERSLNERKNQP